MIEDSISTQIVHLIENGETIKQIFAKLHVSRKRVSAVRKRYLAKVNPKKEDPSFNRKPMPKPQNNHTKEDYKAEPKIELIGEDDFLYKEARAKKGPITQE
jgi:hypothetical protein